MKAASAIVPVGCVRPMRDGGEEGIGSVTAKLVEIA